MGLLRSEYEAFSRKEKCLFPDAVLLGRSAVAKRTCSAPRPCRRYDWPIRSKQGEINQPNQLRASV